MLKSLLPVSVGTLLEQQCHNGLIPLYSYSSMTAASSHHSPRSRALALALEEASKVFHACERVRALLAKDLLSAC